MTSSVLRAALAAARQQELQRAAGCCTAAARHLRELPRRSRLAWRRPSRVRAVPACCPA
jgi:hypothetical protein